MFSNNHSLIAPGNHVNVPVLNSLRAVAALSVCLFHYVCTVVDFTTNEQVLAIFDFGQYGVHMFFVISGFIIPWSMYHGSYKIANFFRFMAKRLIRLEPLYLVSLGIAILHAWSRTLSPNFNGIDTTPTLKQIGLHIGYMIPFFPEEKWIRPVYWTLAIEFQYYLSVSLIFPLLISHKTALRIAVYACLAAGVFLPYGAFLPFYLPIFLLGILLFLFKINLIKNIEFYIASIVCLALIFWRHEIGSFGFSLVTFIAILRFSQFKSAIGDFLGNISYSIYLFHSLTGMLILNYVAHFMKSPLLKTGMVIIAVSVAVGFAYITYRLVESPTKKWSSKIKYKRS